MNEDTSRFFKSKPLYTYNESNHFLQKLRHRKQQQIEEQNKYKGIKYIPKQQTQNTDNQYKGKRFDPDQTKLDQTTYTKQWLKQNRKQYNLERDVDPVYITKQNGIKHITITQQKKPLIKRRNINSITMQLYNNKITQKHKSQIEQLEKRNLQKKLLAKLATKLVKHQNQNEAVSEQRIQNLRRRNHTNKLLNLTQNMLKQNNFTAAQNEYQQLKQQIQQEELNQNNEIAEQQRQKIFEQNILNKPDYWAEEFKDYRDEEIQYSQQELPDNEDLAFKIIPQIDENIKPDIQEIKQYNQKYLNQKIAWNYIKQLKHQFNNNLTDKLVKSFIYNNIVIQIYQPKMKYSKQYQSSQYKKQETLAISQIITSSIATNQKKLDRQKYKNWQLTIRVNNVNSIYILIEMLREYNIFSLKDKFQYLNNIVNMQLYAPKGLHILELQQLINVIPGQIIIEQAEKYGQSSKYLIYYNIYKMTISK